MIYKPRSPVRKCHRHDLEDAKPFLDQIASDDVCEGKLKDYVPLQAVVDTHTHTIHYYLYLVVLKIS